MHDQEQETDQKSLSEPQYIGFWLSIYYYIEPLEAHSPSLACNIEECWVLLKRVGRSIRVILGEERKLSMAEVAYCVKCKEKREMKNPHQIEMKNGKPAMQGECTVCGTKLTRILSAKAK